MEYYVADTHVFVWYLAESDKLSSSARTIFELADRGEGIIILPAIVLLECVDIFDKKKASAKFEDIIAKLNHASNFILSEIDWNLILETNKTKGLKDLHDRVIVATAKIFNAKLLSRDRLLKKYYTKTIW